MDGPLCKADHFFELNLILDMIVGFNRVGPQVKKMGPIRLASNRVQIQVQPYNVLNKPDFGPDWTPGSKFGSNHVLDKPNF
jgi:hypothetical protein